MLRKTFVSVATLAAAFVVVSTASADFTLSNPTPITINDAVTPDVPVPATPYPSVVSVPQVAFGSLSAQRATVTLHNVSHPSPADIKVTLTNGLGSTTLLENAGGTTTPVQNADLTFNGSARRQYFAFAGPMTSASYWPSAYTVSGTNLLASTAPLRYVGGAWSVYVEDQDPGDTGTIANGISVTISGMPDNRILSAATTRNLRRGTAQLALRVPNPGVISIADSKSVMGVTVNAPVAGTYPLTVKAKGRALRRLKKKHRVVLNPQLGFAPAFGTASLKTKQVTLTLKLKKKKLKKK